MTEPRHALWELTLARLREFLREPAALFWTFGFPVLLAVGLGVAFRNRPAEAFDVAVVGTGPDAERVFSIVDEAPTHSVYYPAKWSLVARDAYNGIVIWKKPIGPWEGHLRRFRSGPTELPRRLVAEGERVYVTLGYGKPVSALDAASGEVVRVYEGTKGAHEIIHSDGTLYLVSGMIDSAAYEEAQLTQSFSPQIQNKRILAVNAKTAEVMWTKQDSDTSQMLPTTLCIDDSNTTCAENGSPRWPFRSYENAKLAATSDDVLKVAAGTYPEEFVVGIPLTLRGAGPTASSAAATPSPSPKASSRGACSPATCTCTSPRGPEPSTTSSNYAKDPHESRHPHRRTRQPPCRSERSPHGHGRTNRRPRGRREHRIRVLLHRAPLHPRRRRRTGERGGHAIRARALLPLRGAARDRRHP